MDNVNYLRTTFPIAWKVLQAATANGKDSNVKMELAKNQQPTLIVQVKGRVNYLHSSYNPGAEAARFIDQHPEIGNHQHVFFYGVGLGYHIQECVKRYPDVSFSIYEPNATVFEYFLSVFDLQQWKNQLKNVYLEDKSGATFYNLKHFTQNIKKEVLIVVWPSYERIFQDETNKFVETFRDTVFSRRAYMRASTVFAKRITINNIINLSKVVQTPDILTDGAEFFRGKPAVIVAAGPSLDLEYDNLRYIKENGLAYIVSVGSAINSLIKQGIYPDAAATYDGSVKNATVFQQVVEKEISDIPLLFGTTVGFETLENYPGRLFHFFVERDTIAPYFLRRKDNREIGTVKGYKTISTITLQLLSKLGCNPIILVGQNFAYTQTQQYAKGIDYINPELKKEEKKDLTTVVDVDGNETLTSRTLDMMRHEMQELIASLEETKVINTTKGGARIEGAPYVPLDQVIKERLGQERIVSSQWLEMKQVQYNMDYLQKQFDKMMEIIRIYEQTITRFDELFKEMNHYIQSRNNKQLNKCFTKFDKLFDRLQKNDFNLRVIFPMNNLLFDQIMKMFEEVRFSKDVVGKAKRVMEEFGTYLDSCRTDTKVIKYLLDEMKQKVLGEPVTV